MSRDTRFAASKLSVMLPSMHLYLMTFKVASVCRVMLATSPSAVTGSIAAATERLVKLAR